MTEFQIHTVVKGNTLWGLARKNHTTVDEIIKLNPQLKNRPQLIRIGEKIKLPPKSAEDVDMNVKGMSIEKTGGNSGAKTQKTERTQQLVDPTVKKVKAPAGKDWSNDLLLDPDSDNSALNNSVINSLAQKRVEYIIGKYNPNPAFGKAEYAKKIVDVANTVGIDAVDLAAIVKRESTFKPFSGTSKGIRRGKVINGGPTGIINDPPNDMYQEHRFQRYDSKMAALKKQYGSLEKIFEAKNKNPEMDLGDFGEMLYKYGSASKLKEACTKDYDVNLKVGAYYYKRMLNECNGNKKQAFDRYNGGGTKGYGSDAANIVSNAKSRIVS